MSIERKSDDRRFLEERSGGPLTLGSLLEAIRLGEEESQAYLARKLGISRQHLCDIEKGRKGVSALRAASFARELGYSETQFVRLALQHELNAAGLPMVVNVERSPRNRRVA